MLGLACGLRSSVTHTWELLSARLTRAALDEFMAPLRYDGPRLETKKQVAQVLAASTPTNPQPVRLRGLGRLARRTPGGGDNADGKDHRVRRAARAAMAALGLGCSLADIRSQVAETLGMSSAAQPASFITTCDAAVHKALRKQRRQRRESSSSGRLAFFGAASNAPPGEAKEAEQGDSAAGDPAICRQAAGSSSSRSGSLAERLAQMTDDSLLLDLVPPAKRKSGT